MERTKIVNMLLDDLKPYDKNPRRNDDAVDAVAASIKSFGFKVPIVVDKHNVIIAGHTRYRAAKQLGLTEVPCIKAEHLSPKQVKAFRLADNKTGELAEWDKPMLNLELNSLLGEFDMSLFGFTLQTVTGEGKDDGDSAAGNEKGDDGVVVCPRCKRPFRREELINHGK